MPGNDERTFPNLSGCFYKFWLFLQIVRARDKIPASLRSIRLGAPEFLKLPSGRLETRSSLPRPLGEGKYHDAAARAPPLYFVLGFQELFQWHLDHRGSKYPNMKVLGPRSSYRIS